MKPRIPASGEPSPPRIVRPAALLDAAIAPAGLRTLPGTAVPRTRTPVFERPAVKVGSIVGDYDLVERLGSGGMGTVFVARHRVLGRRVAIKLLSDELASGQSAGRFLNEARAAVCLEHPGIVDVFHFGLTEDRRPYMVMELLTGDSLDRRLARAGRLPVAEAVRVAGRVAETLAVAHRAGIIHRDLKPGNVFLAVDPDGGPDRVKLIDFGVAKLGESLAGMVRTAQHAVLGTPVYMAPEQARASAHVDARADLYALGCILFEMLAGAPPFPPPSIRGIDAHAVLIRAHELQPPPHLAPAVAPPALDALIQRLLAKKPADRPASADEVVSALASLARPRGLRRRSVAQAVVGAAIGAVIAMLGAKACGGGVSRPASAGAAVAAATPVVIIDAGVDAMPPDAAVPLDAAPPDAAPPKPDRGTGSTDNRAARLADPDEIARRVEVLTEEAKHAFLAGSNQRAIDRATAALALDGSATPAAAIGAMAACRLGLGERARELAGHLAPPQRSAALTRCAQAPPAPIDPPDESPNAPLTDQTSEPPTDPSNDPSKLPF